MISRFKNLLNPKTATKQGRDNPKIRKKKHNHEPTLPPQSSASEESRDNNPSTTNLEVGTRNRNLWQEAFAALDGVQQDLLSSIENLQGPNLVQSVADETTKRYRESQEAGWKMSRANGKSETNLRAAAEKILSSVLRFKDLIDAGVTFDPTGHAASAWTIISLGLRITQNHMDRLRVLFEASGTLIDTLTRCAAIETSFRDKDLSDSDHLEDTIVDVYVAVLEFSAAIVSQNRMKIVRRVLTSINSLAEQPLQEFTTKLNSKGENLRKWTEVVEHQYRKLEMKDLDEKVISTLDSIEELTQQVSSIKSTILSAEEHNILEWLSEYDFSASHTSAASRRESGTGDWILDSPQYGEWKTSECSLLWLHGISGSGKTVLCSKIVDDLQDLCAKNPNYALAYWYFTFKTQSSLDIDNLLYSIMRQLCANTQTVPDSVRDLWKRHYATGSRPTRAGVMQVLDSLIAGLKVANRFVLLVLDALDEYPLSSQQAYSDGLGTSKREDVLKWLRQFHEKHTNARVIVMSREENDIRGFFKKASKVDVTASIDDDLDLFISNCIDRIVVEHGWKAQYVVAMFSRIEGINEKRFRWAFLMQHWFSECLDHETMKRALDTLPGSLGDMYADVLMRRIPGDYREKARLMLMWLAYSIRPVTLQELASVASLPEPMDVLRICTSSLVTLSREVIRLPPSIMENPIWYRQSLPESEADIVKFDHFSVKEYILSEGLLASGRVSASYFFVPPLIAHLSIAQTSVCHLLSTRESQFIRSDIEVVRKPDSPLEWSDASDREDDEESGRDIDVQVWPQYPLLALLEKFPLLEYSTFWHKHVWEADAIEDQLAHEGVTKSRLEGPSERAPSTFLQAEHLRTKIHSLFRREFSQSLQNWVFVLDHLTRETPYEQLGKPSPIWYASLLNLPDNVQRLLQSETVDGRTIDPRCSCYRQPHFEQMPIQIAAMCGHVKVLNIFLHGGGYVEQSEMHALLRTLKRNGCAVLKTILEACPYLTLTEDLVKRFSIGARDDIYQFILNSPSLVKLNKASFEYIVENIDLDFGHLVDVGFMETILRRGDELGFSRGEMIKAPVLIEESDRSLEFIVDPYDASSMSQHILALMFANHRCGAAMLAFISEHYTDVQISYHLLALMITNRRCGEEMLAYVLGHCKGIHISRDLLELIVDQMGGAQMLDNVLEYDKSIHISQELLALMVAKVLNGAKLLSVVLKHDKSILISNSLLIAAVSSGSSGYNHVLGLILDNDEDLEVSEEILKAAARNGTYGASLFSAILSRREKIEISEDILKAALAGDYWKDGEVFWTILEHDKNVFISAEVIDTMMENHKLGITIMNGLMDHRRCEIELEQFLERFKSVEELMRNPVQRGCHFHRCKFKISWKMMEAAARWEPEAINFLTAHKRPNVTFAWNTMQATSNDSNA